MQPKTRFSILIACLLIIISSLACSAKVVYVKTTGLDTNDGLSWDTAKKTVTAGLTMAISGDEVHVAQGTYVGQANPRPGVSLYGGYSGIGDTRDIKVYTTILTCSGLHGVAIGANASGQVFRIDGFVIQKTPGNKIANGIYIYGGQVYITNNIIRNANSIGISFQPYYPGDFVRIENNAVIGSNSTGINIASGTAYINNNTVIGCCTTTSGAGIYSSSSAFATVINNTIVGNGRDTNSGGIYCAATSPVTGGMTAANNIIAFNTFGVAMPKSTSYTLSHNCVYGNTFGNYVTGILPGVDDISSDPMLTDPLRGEVHIQPGSPCIGAGDNSVVQAGWKDIDGQDRILPTGGTVDIGADESNGETWTATPPSVIRVTTTGNDANDGSAWDDAHAMRTVQAAITASSPMGEIWVKAGTYNERITMRAMVNLYGGFAGTETSFSQRDFKTNVTILDGQKGGSVVTASNILSTLTILDGFTIRNGSAAKGGGIYCSWSSPTFSNNILTGNSGTTGGAFYSIYYSPRIVKNTITGNTASSYGGGIYCETNNTNADITIEDNVISGNTAKDSGGGVYCKNSSTIVTFAFKLMMKNNIFSGNSCAAPDSMGSGLGGGAYVNGCVPTITGNVFDANSSGGAGGISNPGFGAGLYCISSPAEISNNRFTNNISGGGGGGLLCGSSSTTKLILVNGNTFTNNYVYTSGAGSGGGVSFSGGLITISNNTFVGNRTFFSTVTSGGFGGGVHCGGGIATLINNIIKGNYAFRGGGVACGNTLVTMRNNNISANGSPVGAGVFMGGCTAGSAMYNNTIVDNIGGWNNPDDGAITCSSCSPAIANNIVAFNSIGIRVQSGAVPTLGYNCVFGNTQGDYQGCAAGTTDISSDPKLACLPYGNIHIQPDSPCLNAGDSSLVQTGDTDIDGNIRVQPSGGAVDIGVDESDGAMIWPAGPYAIVRVSPNGDDANDGSTWALAKKTIQAGLEKASESGGQVWVKGGSYSQNLFLRPFVRLLGGFGGTESEETQRDSIANRTVVDARSGIWSFAGVMIHGGGSYQTLDGFTIKRGLGRDGQGIWVCGASPCISHNVLTENGSTAYLSGGGIGCTYAIPFISHNVITNNMAPIGAGIYCELYSSATIANNTIAANQAVCNGMYPTDPEGGGIYGEGSCSMVIVNNTIVANQVVPRDPYKRPSGGVACYSGASMSLANNIIAFNYSGISIGTNVSASIQSNCIFGNTKYDVLGMTPSPIGLNGNISLDPLFVDSANGDYHLTVASPCINKGLNSASGLPTFDYDGEGRIFGGTVDIGADEYWSSALSAADAKKAPENAVIKLSGSTVAGTFPGLFYIEADNRSGGIRVDKSDFAADEDSKLIINGKIKTDSVNGERFIAADTVSPDAGTLDLKPLTLANRQIGGGILGFQDGVWSWDTVKIPGDGYATDWAQASGLNNIGLLVSTFGKVTFAGEGFFYLDDGSSVNDKSGNLGVKVKADGMTLPSVGSMVSVTGISACEKNTDGKLLRLLKVRKQSDILTF